jgi:phospholipase C
MLSRFIRYAAIVAAIAVAGCVGSGAAPALMPSHLTTSGRSGASSSGKYIKHIVLIVQENRSFDNLFATFPGADGATSGRTHKGKTIALKVRDLAGASDINHDWKTFYAENDGGKMDGFDLCKIGGSNQPCGTYAYQYVDPSKIQPYWMLAQQYVLADHMFQTQGSGSFTAHQDLIAGATAINSTQSIIDYPSEWQNWDCDAAPGTTTSLMDYNKDYLLDQGPFPCLTYPTGTLANLLDKKGVSWKYYAPPYTPSKPNAGTLWNAFAAIESVRNGPDWANISTPETNIINDISNAQLPALSWVIPDQPDSDHPNGPGGSDDGPSWVAQVVNAIGTSSYWNSTAVVVVWDDWGGFYDNVPPPALDKTADGTVYGLGFRVPALVVSPYVAVGKISHTQYEFGSILKFIEATFDLGSLGTTDARSTSIGNVFNFKQKPRTFNVIPSKRSRSYFLHRPESALPVDSD